MLSIKSLTAFVTLALVLASATAFTTQWSGRSTTTSLHASRRAFIDATAVAFVVTAGLQVQPAFAEDVDELAMPSEDEQKKADVSTLLFANNSFLPPFSTIAKTCGPISTHASFAQ
jgi:hypothetical protein